MLLRRRLTTCCGGVSFTHKVQYPPRDYGEGYMAKVETKRFDVLLRPIKITSPTEFFIF